MDIGEVVGALGVKLSTALAGLAGGVARVVFMSQANAMSWKRGMSLIALGAISASYLTPLVGLVITVAPDGALDRALAFVIGLLSMTLIELVLRLADWFREDPRRVLDFLRPGSTRPPTGGQS
ncbi:hypothetical protein FHP25_25050 [Vineibacter terrae]|uniref:Uncharacterized protein n=1 Tax=Vineibacter terrae TaxID=2586908 RepID=A0A5C8PFL4_9HYPH|nr:hypothetical protein [Vineibacter terrae]TXL72567.1 hypothetical protein FHP25_25050 [Vineibacter terrae]